MSTTGHPMSVPGYDKWLATEPHHDDGGDRNVVVTVRCPGCTDPELAAPWQTDGVADGWGRRWLPAGEQTCGECGSRLVVLDN